MLFRSLNGWVLGAIFVVGVSSWYLLKKRNVPFAVNSIKIGALFGLISSILVCFTGDHAGVEVARTQPMKLAAMEAYYDGIKGPGLVAFGILNHEKEERTDGVDPFTFKIEIPQMLSLLAERRKDAFVPGINDIINGGYILSDNTIALSTEEKMQKGKLAIEAFDTYRKAMAVQDEAVMESSMGQINENVAYFGYGYLEEPDDIIPNVTLLFYMFKLMVGLGLYFILFFLIVTILIYRKKYPNVRWLQYIALITIPFGYVTGMAGWVVAECGRQPWAIQDLLPVTVGISKLDTSSVRVTFFIFLFLFTIILIAGIRIMLNAIKKGPELSDSTVNDNY